MPRAPRSILVALVLFLGAASVQAAPRHAAFRFPTPGRILTVRPADVNADGREDLVAILEGRHPGDNTVLVLRAPATATPGTFFAPQDAARIAPPPDAAAVAIGRFGEGQVLRFLTRAGVIDMGADGKTRAGGPRGGPGLLGRSENQTLVFWDGAADLDGDGATECWRPDPSGALQVLRTTGEPLATLSLTVTHQASQAPDHMLGRVASIPRLVPADLDGDGTRELVALRGTTLLAWAPLGPGTGNAPVAPQFRLALPFLEPDPALPAEALRTPRIQVEDVDGDGKADLLVTYLTGRRDKLGDLKTILFHYAGPFRDKDGKLTPPASRLDTPSIVLHPSFVDVDGDGDRDYVTDSIRTQNRLDLIARIMGNDPPVTLEGFRFDSEKKRFEAAPAFRLDRVYPSSEAMANTFGQTTWFDGDFDGDGHRDLLDLGNLRTVTVSRGRPEASGAVAFDAALAGPFPMQESLTAGAVVLDLNADGRSDCAFWSEASLYFLVSGS